MNSSFSRHGILFVLSAPSGAGKTTLRDALKQTPDFVYGVSCTTREPRPGEVSGEDYRFVSTEEFESGITRGDFLEYAQVHGRHYYGTPKGEILEHLHSGTDVLIDIDTQGAATIRNCGDDFVIHCLADVFIMPPNLDELRKRLERRGTEAQEQIEERLHSAALEMESWRDYRYTIISGSMEEDVQKFRAIMRAERYLSKRMLRVSSQPAAAPAP